MATARTDDVHSAPLEPDIIDDLESTYGSSLNSETTSVKSAVQEYMQENGRLYSVYWGKNKEFLPTDESEQDRLDIMHECWRLLLDDRIYRSPLETISVQKILDIGTGTGIWAVDMADQFPEAEVIGVDLNPIQPNWVPPNCSFELDDIELPWTYDAASFDFIHGRSLLQSIDDWPKLLGEIYSALRPGGYVELNEQSLKIMCDDDTFTPDTFVYKYNELLNSAYSSIGRPMDDLDMIFKHMAEANFVDMDRRAFKHPMSAWPKDRKLKRVGALSQLAAESGAFQSYGVAVFTRILKMDSKEAVKLCHDTEIECQTRRVHTYIRVQSVFGRKPGDGEKLLSVDAVG